MCFIQIPLCLNPLSHILYTTLSKCSNKKFKNKKKYDILGEDNIHKEAISCSISKH